MFHFEKLENMQEDPVCELFETESDCESRERDEQNEQQYSEEDFEMLNANQPEESEEQIQITDVEIQQVFHQEKAEEPRVGTFYNNIEELFDSYLAYARDRGFSITKKSASKGTGCVRKYQTISCDRGRKSTAYVRTKRINCPARLSAILRENGMWQVSKIVENHNHELDPSMSRFMLAHRSINLNMKRKLEAKNIAKTRPNKSVRPLEVQVGGPDKLDCLPRDCRNDVESVRRLKISGGDVDCINRMFLSMQQENSDFFHLIHADEEGRVDNVFWVHPRSRAAYEEFNDAVSIDSTFLINRYKIPFVSIIGVNHHGHPILLGSALISHEDTETYKWVFRTWLAAMGGQPPIAVMTDQCESMRSAIKEVMPNTIQSYYIFHILCKFPEKFRGLREYTEVKNEFKAVVYDSLTKAMFETNWNQFIAKYGLESNQWLGKLYNERELWVPVYVNHIFWAGMSTQRSENIHGFFDGYIHSNSTLEQFVEQYEIAIRHKVEKEDASDFKSKGSVVKCLTVYDWEIQFQEAYTNEMFEKLQTEIRRMWYCHLHVMGDKVGNELAEENFDEEGYEKFKILEKVLLNAEYVKDFVYSVLYKEEGCFLKCNCRSFESKGLLCAHILIVASMKDVRRFHERYLLRRWRKDVHRRYKRIFFDEGYPHMTIEFAKFKELEKIFNDVADIALSSHEKTLKFKQILESSKDKLLNWNLVESITPNDSEVHVESMHRKERKGSIGS